MANTKFVHLIHDQSDHGPADSRRITDVEKVDELDFLTPPPRKPAHGSILDRLLTKQAGAGTERVPLDDAPKKQKDWFTELLESIVEADDQRSWFKQVIKPVIGPDDGGDGDGSPHEEEEDSDDGDDASVGSGEAPPSPDREPPGPDGRDEEREADAFVANKLRELGLEERGNSIYCGTHKIGHIRLLHHWGKFIIYATCYQHPNSNCKRCNDAEDGRLLYAHQYCDYLQWLSNPEAHVGA